MAWVYRSPKNILNPIKAYNNNTAVNMLEKYTDISKIISNKKINTESKAPFGSNSEKKINIENISISPGPAAYKMRNCLIKKYFNQNITSPNNDPKIKKLFISQEKRFSDKNCITDSPGPGEYYHKRIKTEIPISLYDNKRYKKFGNYELYSNNRVVTIPSLRKNNIIFTQNKNGGYNIKKNLTESTINSNIDPGSYNINYQLSRNNKILNLERSHSLNDDYDKSKNNIIDKNLSTEIINNCNPIKENLMNLNKIKNDDEFLTNDVNNSLKKYYFELEQKEIKQKEKFIKERMSSIVTPGPGEYKLPDNFIKKAKLSKFQNFGSSEGRGLLFPPLKIGKIRFLKNKIEKNLSNSELANNEINKTLDETKKINKNDTTIDNYNNIQTNNSKNFKLFSSLFTLRIKNQIIEEKKIIESNLGPGTYDPILSSDICKKFNQIQNFGSLEKRFPENLSQLFSPPVGSYSLSKSWIPQKSNFKSCVPENITKKDIEGISKSNIEKIKNILYMENHISPSVGQYSPDEKNSIENKSKKMIFESMSNKKPGFNFAEKRFFEFKKKYEDNNQVGKYNIFAKEKKICQQKVAFQSSADRGDGGILDDSKYKVSVGPGAYRYDSYFDWNRKTQNILFV